MTIKNASGVVVARSYNKDVNVVLNEVYPDKSILLTSMNLGINVSIFVHTKAKLKMDTFRSNVKSTFGIEVLVKRKDLKVEDAKSKGGRYRLEYEEDLFGTIITEDLCTLSKLTMAISVFGKREQSN